MKYRVFQIMLEGFSLVNSEFGKDRLPSLQEESFVCAVNFVTFLCPAACARLFGTFGQGEKLLTAAPGGGSGVWLDFSVSV